MEIRFCFKDICLKIIFPAVIVLSLLYAIALVSCGSSSPMSEPDVAEDVAGDALTSPFRIARSSVGTLAVTDPNTYNVYLFNEIDMSLESQFIINGSPAGIAFSGNTLYIGNTMSGAVETYDEEGQYLERVGAVNSVTRPTDIEIDNNKVFVLDAAAKVVRVFNTSGVHIANIPSDAEVTRPLFPSAITIDTIAQEVYISDYGTLGSFSSTAYVRRYDYSGNHISSISGNGAMASHNFSRPQGMYVMNSTYLFLVDAVLGKVLIFNTVTNTGVSTLGSFGIEAGQLRLPLDLVVNGSDVIVTDNRNSRLEVFAGGAVIP